MKAVAALSVVAKRVFRLRITATVSHPMRPALTTPACSRDKVDALESKMDLGRIRTVFNSSIVTYSHSLQRCTVEVHDNADKSDPIDI